MTAPTRWAVLATLPLLLSWPVHADDDDRRQIRIRSGDTAALYGAVGDPANADTLVVLEPGVYPLQVALRLQRNQVVKGKNRYAFHYGTPAPRADGGFANPDTETILDCARVTGPGCVLVTQGGAMDLTLHGASNAALVQVGGAGTSPPYSVLVRRVDLRGGQRGLRVQPVAGEASVRVEQSVVRDTDTSGIFGFGWQVQITGTAAPYVDLAISNSYISRNRYGGFVAGLGNNGTFNIASHANRYVQNTAGVLLHPARDSTSFLGGTSPGAHGNLLVFLSEADDFIGNGRDTGYQWPLAGGIVATTALRTSAASAPHSHNRMWLTVKAPLFVDNRIADLAAYAAVSLDGRIPSSGVPSTDVAGEDNLLFLWLDVGSHTGAFYKCASIPFDSTGTNRIPVAGPDSGAIVENCAVLQQAP